ncbi:sn-glycerol-3-phosphate ABC transporter ATP-binding protein UgpC [Pseudoroseomonas wenyumeiae]|uniref:sn-glycerol-3-phosphate ABC transporter ATP-binding protein UgpC n=1 Tax=Teichococcus wenyumeiae TaxID=2478470 RepID=A0A3A9JHX2_9PROT|nr:sn-glycerol-3-phosphate ABC transporter ATP-binding protein UgpC [Pseudoroseomonas wenyumeiae]RKK06000.1 sn-glycerol-3-phosphate ABC transporter ATP-binding protein UgpC [Pseudoroseomonas wenyumeiae]RMI19517.1 sn-glycerol-3-phosphate ABC transporter ATP-binding protein UgpC [Pseudoroseomonas wenyumeiae]
MATLTLNDIRKSFGSTTVLHGINLDIAEGEMVVIVGASGCGKSTLLRIAAGLETPTSGTVRIADRDVTELEPADRDIAMVFQNYALYPHMTVFDNMAYGLKIRGMTRDAIRQRVEEAAGLLGITPLLSRRPRELSGGQRQRVAMGRAIVREPKLFLFDEPLSNLDAKLRVQMRAEIRRLQRRLGVTSLFVTHDQVEAMTLGDRLVVMNQGRAAQIATPMEIFAKPADTYVAAFIGSPSMNLLRATLDDGGRSATLAAGGSVSFDEPRPGPAGQAVIIGIRPEHVTLGGELPVAIELVEPLGSETVLHGTLPSGEAMAVRVQGAAPVNGGSMPVSFTHSIHVFDAETGKRI